MSPGCQRGQWLIEARRRRVEERPGLLLWLLLHGLSKRKGGLVEGDPAMGEELVVLRRHDGGRGGVCRDRGFTRPRIQGQGELPSLVRVMVLR